MCPLQYLIYLLECFECFKNVTQLGVTEYESCKHRFSDYMTLMFERKGDHLNICKNYDRDMEIVGCNCYNYLYNRPLVLIQEILAVLEELKISKIQSFIYSMQERTPTTKMHICLCCGLEYARLGWLLAHIRRVHWVCEICGEYELTEEGLLMHAANTHHPQC